MLGFTVAPGASVLSSSKWVGGSAGICPSPTTAVKVSSRNRTNRHVVFCGRRGASSKDYKRRGDGRRPNRVGELIRREISPIIDDAFARAFRGDASGSPVIVSVVDVKCSDDLRSARVSVSVLGSDEQRSSALQWLRSAKKEIRFELAQCVRLKYIPELSFTESEMAQAVKTVHILNMLAEEREEKRTTRSVLGEEEEEPVPIGATSITKEQGLDLDASAEDAIILDDLDESSDDEDRDGDAVIIDVTEEDDDLEEMDDEKLRSVLFKTLGSEDFVR